MDQIILEGVEVHYRVGVPESERARPQRLELHLVLHLDFERAIREDRLDGTVDYAAVAAGLERFGDEREWRLIETLGRDIAEWLLHSYPCRRVDVEVRKFILPRVRHVAVRLSRERTP